MGIGSRVQRAVFSHTTSRARTRIELVLSRIQMTAQLIDGRALSRQIRADVAKRTAELTASGHRPGLAVILVGEDPASHIYTRDKVKACAEAGIHSVFEKYDASLTESALLE